jgi:hypothetical protein
MTEHTDFVSRYDKLISDFEEGVRAKRYTPDSVPVIARGLKDEVRDLVAGFRDSEGKRHAIPEPLLPMAKAREYMRRLNSFLRTA